MVPGHEMGIDIAVVILKLSHLKVKFVNGLKLLKLIPARLPFEEINVVAII